MCIKTKLISDWSKFKTANIYSYIQRKTICFDTTAGEAGLQTLPPTILLYAKYLFQFNQFMRRAMCIKTKLISDWSKFKTANIYSYIQRKTICFDTTAGEAGLQTLPPTILLYAKYSILTVQNSNQLMSREALCFDIRAAGETGLQTLPPTIPTKSPMQNTCFWSYSL